MSAAAPVAPASPVARAAAANPVTLQELPVRADLRGQSPYGAPQLPDAVQLNVNENPHPPSAALVADLAAACAAAGASLHRYPDREALELRTRLADYLTARTGQPLAPQSLWAANGSNEVLQHVLMAFGGTGRSALGFEPSYAMHELISRATGTGWVGVARRPDFSLPRDLALAAVAEHDPDVVFLTSPNNPTGTPVAPEVVAAVADAARGMVVVDEAYAEFGTAPSAAALLPDHPRLIVSRTMSKAFALAGARVGYCAAAPAVIDALRLVRLPYHLSALTQAAALVALDHADELLATVADVVAQRRRLEREIVAVGAPWGLSTVPTEANFLLFGPFADPTDVWQQLLDAGVLVRDVSGGRGLAGWLRVCAGTEAECDAFLQALEKVVRQ